MDLSEIAAKLTGPPERVRLAALYPELPNPIPFADACPLGPWDKDEGDAPELHGCYFLCFDAPSLSSYNRYAVTEQHHRIVEEYQAAAERQCDAAEACAAARWKKGVAHQPPPRKPEPEDIPPEGKLTPRQEAFCRHYSAQPVGTRAAILAGYSEENAAPYGSRLLKHPLVLDRIARLRAEQQIHYVVERDTVHDKLETLFFDALGERNHAAAVAALRLQVGLAGLLARGAAKPEAKESQGRGAKKPRKAKVAARRKPTKANLARRKKPRKAKQSQ